MYPVCKDTLLQGKPLEEDTCQNICRESVADLRLRRNLPEVVRPKWNEVVSQNLRIPQNNSSSSSNNNNNDNNNNNSKNNNNNNNSKNNNNNNNNKNNNNNNNIGNLDSATSVNNLSLIEESSQESDLR